MHAVNKMICIPELRTTTNQIFFLLEQSVLNIQVQLSALVKELQEAKEQNLIEKFKLVFPK